jgi:hypothetical protein
MAQEEDYDVPSPEKFMPAGKSYNEAVGSWPTVGPRCPEKPVVHIKTYGIVNVGCCNNTLLKRKELENHKSNLSNEPSERGTGWNIRVLMFCRKQGCQKLVTKYLPISSAKDNR